MNHTNSLLNSKQRFSAKGDFSSLLTISYRM